MFTIVLTIKLRANLMQNICAESVLATGLTL